MLPIPSAHPDGMLSKQSPKVLLPSAILGYEKIPATFQNCIEQLVVFFKGVFHQAGQSSLDQVCYCLKALWVIELLSCAHLI